MNDSTFIPKLYGYWRSSASWRVRWAFELKNFHYEYVPVNILSGENQQPAHLARNVLGLLPVFEPKKGIFLAESLAIIDWLEQTASRSAKLAASLEGLGAAKSAVGEFYFFPKDLILRAQTFALCEMINAETGPLQTPRAQKRHSDDPVARAAWAAHFIREGLRGFAALSQSIADRTHQASGGASVSGGVASGHPASSSTRGEGAHSRYSVGEQITAADLCLVPQIYNALRFGIEVKSEYPTLWAIYERCMATPECQRAAPEAQVDAVKG